jgi:hypothetical protein
MRLVAAILIAALAGQIPSAAQTPKTPPRRAPAPAPKPLPKVTEPAMFTCPMPLGQGVRTQQSFCDVPIGRDAASGVMIPFPSHRGPVTLFEVHGDGRRDGR